MDKQDRFDTTLSRLEDGISTPLKTRPVLIRVIAPLGIGGSSSFNVQTYRVQTRDESGRVKATADTIFLEVVDAEEGSKRIAIPPQVADVIARQRASLSNMTRRQGAKAAVKTRKALGITPFEKKAADA